MPTEKRDLENFEINGDTYEFAGDLQGGRFPAFIDPEYVSDWEAMRIKPILSNTEAMEFDCECILNPNATRRLLGLDLAIDALCDIGCNTYSLQFLCNSPMMVPVRKHRKKRIAKKWAKRYGYKYVLVPKQVEGVSLVNDNEIDILGRTERRIVR